MQSFEQDEGRGMSRSETGDFQRTRMEVQTRLTARLHVNVMLNQS